MYLNFIKLLLQINLFSYPTPISLNFFWNFGFVLGICVVLQLISGIFLVLPYYSIADLAFSGVEYTRWLLRFIYATGASFFFLSVYTYTARCSKLKIGCTGVVVFLCSMVTVLLDCDLTWVQLLFWIEYIPTPEEKKRCQDFRAGVKFYFKTSLPRFIANKDWNSALIQFFSLIKLALPEYFFLFLGVTIFSCWVCFLLFLEMLKDWVRKQLKSVFRSIRYIRIMWRRRVNAFIFGYMEEML